MKTAKGNRIFTVGLIMGLIILASASFVVAQDYFTVDFDYSISRGKTVAFTYTGDSYDEIRWNFGDGVGSTRPNPIHTYNNYGEYNITLWVKANSTLKYQIQKNITLESDLLGFDDDGINLSNSFHWPAPFMMITGSVGIIMGLVGEGTAKTDKKKERYALATAVGFLWAFLGGLLYFL